MMYVSVGRRALEAQTRAKTRVRGIEPTEDQIKKARGLRPRNKRHATAVERVAQRRFIMEVLRACVRDQLACPSNADLDARCRAAGHGGMTPENTLGQLARDGVIARVELYCGHKRVIELLDGSRTRPPPELSPPHKVIHGPRDCRGIPEEAPADITCMNCDSFVDLKGEKYADGYCLKYEGTASQALLPSNCGPDRSGWTMKISRR